LPCHRESLWCKVCKHTSYGTETLPLRKSKQTKDSAKASQWGGDEESEAIKID